MSRSRRRYGALALLVLGAFAAGCDSSQRAHLSGPYGCLQDHLRGYRAVVRPTGNGGYALRAPGPVELGRIARFASPAVAEAAGQREGAKWYRYGNRLVVLTDEDPGDQLGPLIHACFGEHPNARG